MAYLEYCANCGLKNKREYILNGKNMIDCEYVKNQRYVGEHKNGIKHGHGTFFYATGAKYIGEFQNGLKHGKGKHFYVTGQIYVGEWKDGKQHGEGTWTWPDGTKYIGEWKNSKMWNGKAYDVDGNIKATCFKRKWKYEK